ncbi:hypothetical protein V8F06_008139 [Rhypophila decipiens]
MEADWHDQHRQDGLIAVSVVMVTMAAIFVVLRCISRFILIRNPGPDDYLIILAMLLTIGYLINIFILRNNHIGFPIAYLTPENMVTFIKATLAIQVMYYVNICCIKTSILFTYLRFAVTNTFRKICLGTIILHAVFFLVCFVVTLAQCQPLSKMWDITKTADGTCIDTTAFFYFTSAFNILTDIWILVLPIKTLRSINRPTREKYALFLIFGVGTFAAGASIVRLHTIYTYTLSQDPFRDGILVNQWSVIEVTIAISCASVSALKPVFSSRQRRMSRRAVALHSSSGGGGGGGSGFTGRTGTVTGGTGQQEDGHHDENRKSWREQQQAQPWHVRLMASRDYYPAGRDSERERDVGEKDKDEGLGLGQQQRQAMSNSDDMTSSSAGEDQVTPMTVMGQRAQAQMVDMGFPLQRPRLGALHTRGGQGVPMGSGIPEPEPVHVRSQTGTSTDTSSMIIFSPLPQRGTGGIGSAEEGGLSSSGSFLVLQR